MVTMEEYERFLSRVQACEITCSVNFEICVGDEEFHISVAPAQWNENRFDQYDEPEFSPDFSEFPAIEEEYDNRYIGEDYREPQWGA